MPSISRGRGERLRSAVPTSTATGGDCGCGSEQAKGGVAGRSSGCGGEVGAGGGGGGAEGAVGRCRGHSGRGGGGASDEGAEPAVLVVTAVAAWWVEQRQLRQWRAGQLW